IRSVRNSAFQNGNALSAQQTEMPGRSTRSTPGRSPDSTFHIDTYWKFDSTAPGFTMSHALKNGTHSRATKIRGYRASLYGPHLADPTSPVTRRQPDVVDHTSITRRAARPRRFAISASGSTR